MSNELPGNSYSTSDFNSDFVKVGKFTSIAGGMKVHMKDNHPWVNNRRAIANFPFKEKWNVNYSPSDNGKGNIVIGNDVWIGEGVTLFSGVHVGDGAILGAHAVVAKDVPPYAVAVGNPAQIKKFRFSAEEIVKLLEIKWWDWENDVIKENIDAFNDIGEFVRRFG